MTDLIKVQNVYKQISKKNIIQNLNLNIKENSIFVLLGPNGAGKSTTIKLLNGILKPDSGEITMFGKSFIDVQAREKIGILSDTALPYNQLSAIDNIVFFGELYGMIKKDIYLRMETLLHRLNMYQYRNQKYGTFSTGMKKRIQLIKAVIHNPDLLFLDECTTGLDPESTLEVNSFIKEMNEKEGKTIFLCSHHLDEVEILGNDFGFMYNGNIFSQGTLKDLQKKFDEKITIKINDYNNLPNFILDKNVVIEGNTLIFKLKGEKELSEVIECLVLSNKKILDINIYKTNLKDIYFSLLEDSKNEMD